MLNKRNASNRPNPLDNYTERRIKAGQTKLQGKLNNAQLLKYSGNAKKQGVSVHQKWYKFKKGLFQALGFSISFFKEEQ